MEEKILKALIVVFDKMHKEYLDDNPQNPFVVMDSETKGVYDGDIDLTRLAERIMFEYRSTK